MPSEMQHDLGLMLDLFELLLRQAVLVDRLTAQVAMRRQVLEIVHVGGLTESHAIAFPALAWAGGMPPLTHGLTSALRQTPNAPLPTSSPSLYFSCTLLPSTLPQKMLLSPLNPFGVSLFLALLLGDPSGLHPPLLVSPSPLLELIRFMNDMRDAENFLVNEGLLNDEAPSPGGPDFPPGRGGVAAPPCEGAELAAGSPLTFVSVLLFRILYALYATVVVFGRGGRFANQQLTRSSEISLSLKVTSYVIRRPAFVT